MEKQAIRVNFEVARWGTKSSISEKILSKTKQCSSQFQPVTENTQLEEKALEENKFYTCARTPFSFIFILFKFSCIMSHHYNIQVYAFY